MTWSYDVTSPIARNLVRERIGDAAEGDPKIQNEIIDRNLVRAGTTGTATNATDAQILTASVYSARIVLAALIALPQSRSVESLSITRAPADIYRDFLTRLETEAGMTPSPPGCTMTVGGISISEDEEQLDDPDYDRAPFGPAAWGSR